VDIQFVVELEIDEISTKALIFESYFYIEFSVVCIGTYLFKMKFLDRTNSLKLASGKNL
jgi:hypothetical protein